MNGGSEHLNSRSQWVRVEFQILTTNMRCGNRILTRPSKRVFDLFWLIAYQATAGARRCNLSANGFLTKSGYCTGGFCPAFPDTSLRLILGQERCHGTKAEVFSGG